MTRDAVPGPSRGAARRAAILALCPRDRLVIDVGADHGYVAAALGGIATERMPNRRGDAGSRWVICDGLRAFREAPAVVIAGMGWRTIQKILAEGPTPGVAVLHAQDDPEALRVALAAAGFRIDAEALAPEAGRYAEIVRVLPGSEPASGLRLRLGPRLLDGDDPHRAAHFAQLAGYHRALAAQIAAAAPDRAAASTAIVAFLEAQGLGGPPPGPDGSR